jgi:hypothetical protein
MNIDSQAVSPSVQAQLDVTAAKMSNDQIAQQGQQAITLIQGASASGSSANVIPDFATSSGNYIDVYV